MKSTRSTLFRRLQSYAALAALIALPAVAQQAPMPMMGMGGMGAMAGMAGEESCMGKDGHKHGHHHGMMGEMGQGRMQAKDGKGFMPPFLRGIDLTEAQQGKIKELTQKNFAEAQGKGEAMFKQHRALHDLAFAPKYNEAEAKRLANEIAQSQSEMMLNRVKLEQQIFATLTPEQQSKVSSNMKEFADKMAERMAKKPTK